MVTTRAQASLQQAAAAPAPAVSATTTPAVTTTAATTLIPPPTVPATNVPAVTTTAAAAPAQPAPQSPDPTPPATQPRPPPGSLIYPNTTGHNNILDDPGNPYSYPHRADPLAVRRDNKSEWLRMGWLWHCPICRGTRREYVHGDLTEFNRHNRKIDGREVYWSTPNWFNNLMTYADARVAYGGHTRYWTIGQKIQNHINKF